MEMEIENWKLQKLLLSACTVDAKDKRDDPKKRNKMEYTSIQS